MHITNISDAKSSLSQLIKAVQTNKEPIIIGKAGKPVAVLTAYIEDESPRKLTGNWKGKVKMTEDLDTKDNELVESFYNSSIFSE